MPMKGIAVLLMGACLLCCTKTTNTESESTAKDDTPTKVESDVSKIHLLTVEIKGDNKNTNTTKKLSTADETYFEITLSSGGNGTWWEAHRDIIRPTSIENYNQKFIDIVDVTTPDTARIRFNGPTEFLNFMAARGYDMVDQKKAKSHVDYTFKKE